MEAELVALATSGATTLITLMISDAWAQAKERLAGILSRPGNEDDVLGELEASRADLVDVLTRGDGVRAAAIEAEWRARLLRMLLEVPGSADALRNLPAPPTGTVYNHISGSIRSGVVVQAGRIEGSAFSAPPDTTQGQSLPGGAGRYAEPDPMKPLATRRSGPVRPARSPARGGRIMTFSVIPMAR